MFLANLGGDNAIANLGGDNAIAKKNNYHGSPGKVFRAGSTKAANNAVRAELLRSLGNTFGFSGMSEANGKATFSKEFMDKLEGFLGPAFKREDFGIGADGTVSSGKPLTQRRIQAVERAVADAATRLDDAVAAAKLAAKGAYSRDADKRFGTLDALIASAMKATGGDEALMRLLQKKKVIDAVLVGGDGIRTEEAVQAKVAALKANVDELRAATKGYRAKFEAGLRGLANLGGKTFAKGCITAMVREASAAKIGAIRKLSATSNAGQIHNAVAEYHKLTQGIMKKTNALSSFADRTMEEFGGTRAFIGMQLFARCTPSKLRAMDAAFRSVSATKTSRLYQIAVDGGVDKTLYGPAKAEAIQDAARHIGFVLFDMSANVSEILGEEPFPIDDFEGKFSEDEEMMDSARDVMEDLEAIADQRLADRAADVANAAANP